MIAVETGRAFGAGWVRLGGGPWAVEPSIAQTFGKGQSALGAVHPSVTVHRVAGPAGAVGAWPALSTCVYTVSTTFITNSSVVERIPSRQSRRTVNNDFC